MKLAFWPTQFVVASLVFFAWATPASAVVEIDAFGPPRQSIIIQPSGSVAVKSPFGPSGQSNFTGPGDPATVMSGTYTATGNSDPLVSGSAGYTGPGTFYSYSDFNTLTGRVVSSESTGGMTDFSQRDAQMVVTGTGGTATYTADGFMMSGGGGPSATLLLQYDGVDTSLEVGTFANAKHLDDGNNLNGIGYDLSEGGINNGIYFNGVYGSGSVEVTVRVWTQNATGYGIVGYDMLGSPIYGATAYQEATYTVALDNTDDAFNPKTFAVLYSTFNFNGSTYLGATDFNEVRGIDIIFTIGGSEDINFVAGPGSILATNPEPATLAMWSLFGAGGLGLSWLRRRKLAAA